MTRLPATAIVLTIALVSCATADETALEKRRPDCARDFEIATDVEDIASVGGLPISRSPAAARHGEYGLLIDQPAGDTPDASWRIVVPLDQRQLETRWTHITFRMRAADVFEYIRGQANIALNDHFQEASKTEFSYRTDWKKILVPLPEPAALADKTVELVIYFNLNRRDGPFQMHIDEVYFERRKAE